MRWPKWWLLALLLATTACAGAPPVAKPSPPQATALGGSGGLNAPSQREKPYVIIVGFDGFRWDYLDRFNPPNFRRVIARGVRADGLIPVFPSKTFPNHYSIVTGLYAENHGIVANAFYDPARGRTYSLGDRESVTDGTWYRGEPIWVTAETQGMVAACFFWPGSEAAIKGVRPTFWNEYDDRIPNDRRVDTVIGWLRQPVETRPHVITLYFSDVDTASHDGLSSDALRDAVLRVDRALGRLLTGIDSLPTRALIYLVLVSDHGMTDTSAAQTTLLGTLIDVRDLVVPDSGPVANIHVSGGEARARVVRDALNAKLEHGRAYLRAEIPDRLRYRGDPRIGDVVAIMQEHYMLALPRPGARPRASSFGMHGWDPALESMHGIFVASGPGIAGGARIPRFENVHIYPWLVHLLGLRPAAPLDGDAERLRALIEAAGIESAVR
jgi:predicted AlkP superfamily pyrophosphatase or phosphodiesterase